MGVMIYDFHCKNCGLTLEAFVNNGSEDKPKCPKCDTEMVRLMPAPTWKWGGAGVRGF